MFIIVVGRLQSGYSTLHDTMVACPWGVLCGLASSQCCRWGSVDKQLSIVHSATPGGQRLGVQTSMWALANAGGEVCVNKLFYVC